MPDTNGTRADEDGASTADTKRRYRVEPDMPILVLLGKALSNLTYFGDDANELNPDRMIDMNLDFDHFVKAWKPFGNGLEEVDGKTRTPVCLESNCGRVSLRIQS